MMRGIVIHDDYISQHNTVDQYRQHIVIQPISFYELRWFIIKYFIRNDCWIISPGQKIHETLL